MSSTLAVYELSYPDRPPLEDRVLEALAPEAREEYLDARARRRRRAPRSRRCRSCSASAQAFERAFVKAGGLLGAGRRSHRHGRRAARLRRSAQLRAADRGGLLAGRSDSDHDAQRREDAGRGRPARLDRRRQDSPISSSFAATRSRRPATSGTSRSCSRTASATTRRSCWPRSKAWSGFAKQDREIRATVVVLFVSKLSTETLANGEIESAVSPPNVMSDTALDE